ncbi:DUF2281 domain-containing protein [Tumidithrix helvetica PCC 7403]|uniref:hypothetical protein n=1 Tax=Tumidithrix helvetica TaxID=3457545 RepID=UPI003CAE676E
MLKPITLEVEAPIADAYQNATLEHRQALEAIVSLYLKSISIPLQTVSPENHAEAQQKGITPDREIPNKMPKRTTPAHLAGKVEILGDIVSPIVDEEDWECLK